MTTTQTKAKMRFATHEDRGYLYASNGDHIGDVGLAYAADIVHACNMHEEWQAVMKELIERAEDLDATVQAEFRTGDDWPVPDEIVAAHALLSKAQQ